MPKVELPNVIECPDCGGTGVDDADLDCLTCMGEGVVDDDE